MLNRANILSSQFSLPEGIVRGSVETHSLLWLAVMLQVCLHITVKMCSVEPAWLCAGSTEE